MSMIIENGDRYFFVSRHRNFEEAVCDRDGES
jgi:hypothetical protein